MYTGIIKNGFIFTEEGKFEKRDLYIRDGLITDHPVSDCDVIDATGLFVVPGFVDVHTHGAVGHDFCDASKDGLIEIARFERSVGVTSFLPTSMSFHEDKLSSVFASAKEAKELEESETQKDLARIIGVNMEGPFISYEKRGAQNEEYILKPDVDMFRRLNNISNNMIRLVTLAAEVDGAKEFIDSLADEVNISLGHSAAGYDVATNAFKKGANHVTHLFNGMNGFLHRDTGIIGAAADDDNVYVELICDGVHISPAMIRSVYKIFGQDRIVAISDSMEACGMADGDYELGGQRVHKTGNVATLENGTIAGSVTNLFDCFKFILSCNIPVEAALKMVTINPAKSIGMENKVGILKQGAFADILLLDKNYNLVRVI